MSVSRKDGKTIYYTDDELKAAEQNNNALQYALSRGYQLIKFGNEFHLKEHDSMVFKQDGRWYWNSQDKHGRALDFIQAYESRSFSEAICILAGTIDRPAPVGPPRDMPSPATEEKGEFILPEHAGSFKNLFAYLIKERGIDAGLVKDMVEHHKIYQGITYNKLKIAGYDRDGNARYAVKEAYRVDFSKLPLVKEPLNIGTDGAPFNTAECLSPDTVRELLETNQIRAYQNLVMVGFDKSNVPHYASMRSMNSSGKAVKVDVTGSDKSYPFVLEGRAGNATVCVFESPVEAMSYWSLCKITSSDRINFTMISLGGAGTSLSLDRYLKEHPEVRNIVMGLNNDSQEFGHKIDAGRNGTGRIVETYGNSYHITKHQPHLNDWNDVLKNYRHNLEGQIPSLSRASARPEVNRGTKDLGVAI